MPPPYARRRLALLVALAFAAPSAFAQEFLLVPASPEDGAAIEVHRLDAPGPYAVERMDDRDGDGIEDYLLTALADSAAVVSGTAPRFVVSGQRGEYPRVATVADASELAGARRGIAGAASTEAAAQAAANGAPAAGTLTLLMEGGGEYAVELEGSIYFRGYTAETGTELFRYSPGGSGPVLAADIVPGPGDSSPSHLTRVGGVLYFSAYTAETGYELFRYDPAVGQAALVAEGVPGAGSLSIFGIAEADGGLLLSGRDDATGTELWRYNSSTGQVALIGDIFPGFYTYSYYVSRTCRGSFGRRYECGYYTTGTGTNSSSPGSLTLFGGDIYFRATAAGSGSELWRYETATGAVVLVDDIFPGQSHSLPLDLEVLGDYLYFQATTPETGTELFRYSLASGVALVGDVRSGPASSSPTGMTAHSGRLYFGADAGDGHRLMQYDPATSTVSPLAEARVQSKMTPLYDALYFQGSSSGAGNELWAYSIGLSQAAQVADINSGTASSSPAYLTALGGSLYFRAYYYRNGLNGGTWNGLWSFTPPPPTPVACSTGAPLAVGAFSLAAGAESVTLTNTSAADEVDLGECTLVVFDPYDEVVLSATAFEAVRLAAGWSAYLPAALTAGPGAFALVEGAVAPQTNVVDLLGTVVAAVVYDEGGAVYVTGDGTRGECGNGPGLRPCNSPEGQAAMSAAFAALYSGATDAEGDADDALAVTVWPNPSASGARVSFGLAEGAAVRVSVYDALGREVAVLAEGPHTPGRHEAALDAGALAPGVYVVRLASGADVRTARLTVAR